MGLRVEYDTHAFDSTEIATVIGRFERVLEAMTADAAQRLSAIDVLDAAERGRLDGWGNAAVLRASEPTPLSIPEVFAAQVARNPDAPAVTFEGRTMSYRELDEASNRLAHQLVDHGAGPGQYVALLLPRSAQAIVAMLAVLKSGAAYLAMDPAVPEARLEFMLGDVAPVAVVTTAGLRARVAESGLRWFRSTARRWPRSPPRRCRPGRRRHRVPDLHLGHHRYPPKGVVISHRNLTQLVESAPSDLPSGPGQTWSQWHSLVFDVSVWEIFGSLLSGTRLVIVPEAVAGSPTDLHDLLVARRSTSSATPRRRRACWIRPAWSARRWCWAARPCPPSRWSAGAAGRRVLVNGYGPRVRRSTRRRAAWCRGVGGADRRAGARRCRFRAR